MSLELTVLEQKSPIEIFQNKGLDPVLEAITNEVKSFVPDLTTEKGRKEIASLAYKVAKSKTLLDDLGKNLVAEWKEQSKLVDNERKRMRDYLDNLKEEVRRPLTEYEEREEKRLQKHKDGIEEIKLNLVKHGLASNSSEIKEAINKLEALDLSPDKWDEFSSLAEQKQKEAITYLSDLLIKREQHEKEQAELEVLRKEKAEREKREHEERIAKEAAEKAKAEAEAKAKADQERLEKEKKEAIEKQKKAEEEARLAKERAEKEKIEAEKRAKENEERARTEERLRIQRENERIEQEAKKREADIAHRKMINNEILVALKAECSIDDEVCKKIITAIATEKIPNVKLNY